jgi:flagellar hook-basal body complex protein FliE
MSIAPVSAPIGAVAPSASSAASAPGASGAGFSQALGQALGGVGESLSGADRALAELASGESVDLHGTMIAMEQADIALRVTVSARDKFVAAYEQIMNMAL